MPLLHRPERARSRKKNLAHRIVDAGRLHLSLMEKMGCDRIEELPRHLVRHER